MKNINYQKLLKDLRKRQKGYQKLGSLIMSVLHFLWAYFCAPRFYGIV